MASALVKAASMPPDMLSGRKSKKGGRHSKKSKRK